MVYYSRLPFLSLFFLLVTDVVLVYNHPNYLLGKSDGFGLCNIHHFSKIRKTKRGYSHASSIDRLLIRSCLKMSMCMSEMKFGPLFTQLFSELKLIQVSGFRLALPLCKWWICLIVMSRVLGTHLKAFIEGHSEHVWLLDLFLYNHSRDVFIWSSNEVIFLLYSYPLVQVVVTMISAQVRCHCLDLIPSSETGLAQDLCFVIIFLALQIIFSYY